MASTTGRSELLTWLLLLLALVPTWSVLAGATWLWRERGQEIEQFQAAFVPVDATYELFLVSSSLRRTESSLRLAALPDATDAETNAALADRAETLIALEDAAAALVPLVTELAEDGALEFETASQSLGLLTESFRMSSSRLTNQVVGETVDPQFALVNALGRDAIGGLVLPLADVGNAEINNLYNVVSTTIQYVDQFDRDRTALVSEHLATAAVDLDQFETASALRLNLWKDVVSSRSFLRPGSSLDWFGTASNVTATVLIDTAEPVTEAVALLAPARSTQARSELFRKLGALEDALVADVNLGYSEIERLRLDHLDDLVRSRSLTALVSSLMALMGVALALLTISEVRRRRRVESAHDEALRKLSEKADRDPTTGVWNRRWLEYVVPKMIGDANSRGETVVLAYLDLDHFKAINDVWGHRTGDSVLNTVTERLADFSYRSVPFELSRIGGDEFVLFACAEAPPLDWLEGLGEEILLAVDSKMKINGRHHEVRASVGIATGTRESTLDSLLLEADSSLILAKQERGTAVVYDREVSRTGELVHALPQALTTGQIGAYLQPVVDIHTGAISHVEALARWHRPNGDQVSPTEFIPLVESYGLAEELTTAMLASVQEILHDPETPRNVRVWANVSPHELDVAHFAERIIAMLRKLEIAPTRIGIEITETAAVRDPKRLAIELRRLRSVGVAVAIDDFGNGYSPLGYLRDLPVDIVKLDRSLVANIDQDRANQHLVIGIVGLVRELGMDIVAEGVERWEERDWLAIHGVNRAQGYLFGRPSAPADLAWTAEVGVPADQSPENGAAETVASETVAAETVASQSSAPEQILVEPSEFV